MKVRALLCFGFFLHQCMTIDIDDITLSNCADGSDCSDATNTGNYTQSTTENNEFAIDEGIGDVGTFANSFDIDDTKDSVPTTATSLSTQKLRTITTTPIPSTTTMMSKIDKKIGPVNQNHSNICTCDMTISSCDINCCCDLDCSEFQLTVFSHCDDHRPKLYDSRYCYTKNFIQRNNTRFILERLADNLFCIAYDNLPPIYDINHVPDLKNQKAFDDARQDLSINKFMWEWNNLIVPDEFNSSNRYHDADVLWKFHANIFATIDLPQTGFTAYCTFMKTVKYLESSKWSCMQTDLSNDNLHLFTEMYNNFTVISSPHLFNATSVTSEDSLCPINVCVPIRSLYCLDSWTQCNETYSLKQGCTNGECKNVVKKIRYTIVHNGTNGVQSIEVHFELTNTSQAYYQYFEVAFKWNAVTTHEIFSRSGNPGYIIGNPIITGSLVSNITNNVMTEYVNVSKSDYYLTVPTSHRNGDCATNERYIVGFGEDVRLRCRVQLTTHNFSSLSCMELQNQTFKFLLKESLNNVTEVDKYKMFVSRNGDIFNNDTSSWTQIILDRIPRNVVTGQIYNNNRIRCSGLVTSLHIEILHTILPKPVEADNHKIAGVALTFSEPTDISWSKCFGSNCTDTLMVQLLSIVSFNDISTPSMYYYAGGPNLDISLPYDFFYPFMCRSTATKTESLIILLGFSLFNVNIDLYKIF